MNNDSYPVTDASIIRIEPPASERAPAKLHTSKGMFLTWHFLDIFQQGKTYNFEAYSKTNRDNQVEAVVSKFAQPTGGANGTHPANAAQLHGAAPVPVSSNIPTAMGDSKAQQIFVAGIINNAVRAGARLDEMDGWLEWAIMNAHKGTLGQ